MKSAAAKTDTLTRLRRQIAETEATLASLQNKLAKAEAAVDGTPAPVCGLDLLWQAALPMSRTRSSKHRCRTAWNRLPKSERPPLSAAIAALIAWNRCEEWRKNDNAFAPGLHRFISERIWESLPEGSKSDPLCRYRSASARTAQTPGEGITDVAEIAALLSLKYREP